MEPVPRIIEIFFWDSVRHIWKPVFVRVLGYFDEYITLTFTNSIFKIKLFLSILVYILKFIFSRDCFLGLVNWILLIWTLYGL